MASSEIFKWMEEAIAEQQEYFEFLGKRGLIKYKPSDFKNFKRNIGYAVFGPPSEEPRQLNDFTGYSNNQLKHINEIFGAIIRHTDKLNVYVSFILVTGKQENNRIRIPLIKMQEYDVGHSRRDTFIFIDTCPRVYKGWQDYLDNNKLPECEICYPRNGTYSETDGAVDIEFGMSPAGNIGQKVLADFDAIESRVGIVAAGVAIVAAFFGLRIPRSIAVAAMVTGAYRSGRSIQNIVDRDRHDQSIGLDNPDSRNCWLGIGGGVMGIAYGGVTVAAHVAQIGKTAALAGQRAMMPVKVGSYAVAALRVANVAASTAENIAYKESVTTLNAFQFSSSVLFFTNAVISTDLARALLNSIGGNRFGEITDNVKTAMSRISQFAEKITLVEKTGFVELDQYQEDLINFVLRQ